MEKLTDETLRELQALVYSVKEIDALFQAVDIAAKAIAETMKAMAAALSEWNEKFVPWFNEIVEQLKATYYPAPPQKLPRPPRYAGPRNKGTLYTQRPPRLARSCCRKMRR